MPPTTRWGRFLGMMAETNRAQLAGTEYLLNVVLNGKESANEVRELRHDEIERARAAAEEFGDEHAEILDKAGEKVIDAIVSYYLGRAGRR